MLSTFLFLDQIVWAGRTGIYKVCIAFSCQHTLVIRCRTVYDFTLILPTNLHGDKQTIENSSTVYAEQGASRVPRQDSILLLSRFQYLYYYH
jgi:hypothetical protein